MFKSASSRYAVFAVLLMPLTTVAMQEQELVDPTRPYDAVALPDPVTGLEPEPDVPLPVLQAVFAQGHKHSALLDGRRVYVGDEIGPFRVVAMNAGEVVLEKNGEQTVLRIGLAAVKQRSLEEAK